jgi:hypothetical protein
MPYIRAFSKNNLEHETIQLYQNQEHQLIMPEDFFLPFGGTLNKNNRWVRMIQISLLEGRRTLFRSVQKGYSKGHTTFLCPSGSGRLDYPAASRRGSTIWQLLQLIALSFGVNNVIGNRTVRKLCSGQERAAPLIQFLIDPFIFKANPSSPCIEH